ncbi:hypothetical protein ACOCJ7_00115 [Knoellia sp. CPCC 206453]|uniref:hypothetical protein n=1 Tax=Knoellia pratensis TaxID=3404796 RepID=UPI003623AA5B
MANLPESESGMDELPNGEAVTDPLDLPDATDVQPSGSGRRKAPAVTRPYPRRTLEDGMKVAVAIKTGNNGKPWPPDQVAKALGMGTGSSFFYLTQAARDFGLTEGTRDAQFISLTDLGRKAVFPNTPQDADDAKLEAFLSVDKFKGVAEHYGGSNLPEEEFVKNTLQTQFALDPRVHEEFLEFFKKNCRYVGIGANWDGKVARRSVVGPGPRVSAIVGDPMNGVGALVAHEKESGQSGADVRPTCFVAMPFSEKSDDYATGFFSEVYASLFVPAIEAAGLRATTARRQGSDVIQATIVNDLLDADLVLVDLTEHNPNVLFELGIRIAEQKPTVLVKAIGTNPIFDVDHLLRVVTYNPNLWPSTVMTDLPVLTAHIQGAWEARHGDRTYMQILRANALPVTGG